MARNELVLFIARLFLFVREAGGQNHGQRVEAIQRWCGGAVGESWCAYFATLVLDLAYGGSSPIPRMGSVQQIRDVATKQGWITKTLVPGDLFIYVNAQNHGHHIGFFTGGTVRDPVGIAGNTDASGTSSNGDRVAEHALSHGTIEYVHLPEVG